MKYWLGKNGQQQGPYELAELQRMLAEGGIGPGDLAWTQGMAAWAPALEIVQPAPQEPAATIPIIHVATALGQVRAPAPAPAPDPEPFAQPQPQYSPEFNPAPPAAAQPYNSAPQNNPAPPNPPQPYAAPQPYSPPQPAQPYAPVQPYAPAQPYNPPQANPQGQFGQPQYGQPQGFGQPFQPGQMGAPMAPPAAAMAGPVPPGMHWALVWVIGAVTFGIFILVWIFKQANFVQSIDPRSKAKMLYTAGIGLEVLYIVMAVGGAMLGANGSSLGAILLGLGALAMLGAVVCIILGHFKMRDSLLQYYNSTENIGLRLSGVMTFFFNILYFQHHFTRIADWKRTGVLRPQK